MVWMPVIYGEGISKSMRSFMMSITNRRIGMGESDWFISLLDLLVVDGWMLGIWSAWIGAGKG